MKSEIEVPDGWEEVKLGNCAKINMGQSPPSSTYNSNGKGIPFFQGNTDFGTKYPKIRVYTSKPTKKAHPNEILMSVRAPVGALNFCNTECCIGRGLCSIKINEGPNEFLFYFLDLKKNELNKSSTGSTFVGINKEALSNLKILLPPISEQQKIAEILSKVDEQIQQTEEIIEKTEELKKGLIQKLLTKGIGHTKFKKTELGEIPASWEKIELRNHCKLIVPQRDKPKKFDDNIPWIRIEDFNGKYISESKSGKCVSRETVRQMPLRPYPIGTVLCSCSGNMGICAITKTVLISNQTFIGIVPHSDLDSNFLYYYLSHIKKRLEKLGAGVTIHYISRVKFETLKILLPSLNEQQQIASILSKVDKQIQDNKKELKHLKELKKGLMQDLLTGNVRVTV